MIVKTRAALSERVASAVKEMHSYAVPAIIVIPLESVDQPYLEWLMAETERRRGNRRPDSAVVTAKRRPDRSRRPHCAALDAGYFFSRLAFQKLRSVKTREVEFLVRRDVAGELQRREHLAQPGLGDAEVADRGSRASRCRPWRAAASATVVCSSLRGDLGGLLRVGAHEIAAALHARAGTAPPRRGSSPPRSGRH